MAAGTVPTAWSYSAFDMWRQCPLRYRLAKVDKLEMKASPALLKGRKVHLELAAWIEGKPVPPPSGVVKFPEQQNLYQAMRDFDGLKVVEQQWGFNAEWKETTWFGKDVWLRAVLDVGLIYDKGRVEVVDHKTGKRYGSNDDQMELFAVVAAAKWKDVTHVTTRLIYVDINDQELADFPAKDIPKLREKWTEAARPMLGDRQWPARPNDKCIFCDFGASKGGVCRFG